MNIPREQESIAVQQFMREEEEEEGKVREAVPNRE